MDHMPLNFGLQDAMQLGPHSRARARPQTAAASTYRGRTGTVASASLSTAPPVGVGGLTGVTRPPTRQKPPPVSLRLENNGRSTEMMKPLETAVEEEGLPEDSGEDGNEDVVRGLSSDEYSD